MLARSTTSLPAADACYGVCMYEPKLDGFRCIAFRSGVGDRVELQSRQGRPLAGHFPEIARLVRDHVPAGTVLDGELIIWTGGRLDFSLLQRRLTASPRKVIDWVAEHPAHLVLFDVLQVPPDLDVRPRPLLERRGLLEQLLVDAPPQLALSPQTTSVELAREWLETWPAAGVEGVLIKGAAEPYRSGRRGWLKLRQRSSTEAIIAGVTGSLAQPETLLLGRRDTGGVLRYVGRTRPVTAVQRQELRGALHRVGAAGRWAAEHPWPRPLPAGWIGQWSSPEPLRYVQVEPDTIAEVEVDAAYEDGRWRHQTRFLRIRTDLSIFDAPLADTPP
jgi:ATP-dependent DNA ligase